MPRLFVAVVPPEDVVAVVRALDRPEVPGLRWTGPDQWHVTLRFLGQVGQVEPVTEAMAGLAGAGRAEARLGPAVARFGRHVLHVPVAGLDALAADVARHTRHLGQPPDHRAFTGHLTLARVARRSTMSLQPLTGAPAAGRWTVEEVCLIESRQSPAGGRYAVLERIPLASSSANR